MIDNGLALPDNDLLNDPKVKYKYGYYRRRQFCKKCRWFQGIRSYQVDCCPNCGEEVETVVGRYKIKTVEKGFFFKRRVSNIFGFTPKEIPI